MVAVAGVSAYKVSVSDVVMLDLKKENVETLAEGESGVLRVLMDVWRDEVCTIVMDSIHMKRSFGVNNS